MNNKRNIIRMKSIKFSGNKKVQLKTKEEHIIHLNIILKGGGPLDFKFDQISKRIPYDIAEPYLRNILIQLEEDRQNVEIEKQSLLLWH